MPDEDFRPLSLGEVLDRSFSLYRRHFGLFVGISAFPHFFTLSWYLVRDVLITVPSIRARALGQRPPGGAGMLFPVTLLSFIVEACFVYLIGQSGIANAVSDLYRGRSTSVAAALRQSFAHVVRLAGCTILNAMALVAGFLFLTVPGLVLATRLIVALPAAAVENLGPTKAFRRSFELTRDFSGWSYLIYLLYLLLRISVGLALFYPQRLAGTVIRHDAQLGTLWFVAVQVAGVAASTVIGPILWISATVFYFNLRVRKEALDLQWMMNPENVSRPILS
jgi:hypothetical protein